MPWSPNVRIPNQLSKASPALSAIESGLHMVHLGDESNNIWHSVFDGDQWSPNVRVPDQKSTDPPAFSENLTLRRGNQADVLLASNWLGDESWSDSQPVQLHTDPLSQFGPIAGYPAMARVPKPGDDPVMVFQNGDGSGAIMFRAVFPVLTDVASQTGVFTRLPPALVFHNGTLHMVHVGVRGNDLWHSVFDQSSGAWSEEPIDGQLSFASPALASFNGRLHMVHLGDSSKQIWHSVFIEDLDSWTQSKVPNQSSSTTPALAAFDGSLHMVHTGESSNRLWHSQFQDS